MWNWSIINISAVSLLNKLTTSTFPLCFQMFLQRVHLLTFRIKSSFIDESMQNEQHYWCGLRGQCTVQGDTQTLNLREWTNLGVVSGQSELCHLTQVDLVPTRRTSVLLLLSLRKLYESQDLISNKLSERELGGSRPGGQIELGVISIAVELNTKFSKDMTKR